MRYFDFGVIGALQPIRRWDDAIAELIASAQRLERGGTDAVVICTNTMYRMADRVQLKAERRGFVLAAHPSLA